MPLHDTKSDLVKPLYTPEQRKRRDNTIWTIVQGVLAPIQFVVFLISISLVTWYLTTGDGYDLANISILIKTFVLLSIMVTGAIWEKVVFGQYLLAPPFFWEDVVSFFVIALHTAHLIALYYELLSPTQLMFLTLAAYLTYAANAIQFLLKLRAARQQSQQEVQYV